MAKSTATTVKSQLAQWISNEYRDLNGTNIEVLDTQPTPLQFSRMVHISRPVLMKRFIIPATRKWTNEHLIRLMGDRLFAVATTPTGRADAVIRGPDGKFYFTEPYVEEMSMREFLSKLGSQDPGSDIVYLQSQNGNLYSSDFFIAGEAPTELDPLREDVPSEISWCTEALGRPPDAVNVWIGDSRSTTSLHSDPYENIYTVVRGEKHFTLFPPSDGWCMKERSYPHARFARPSSSGPLQVVPSEDVPPVRWSSIQDPNLPGILPPHVKPIHVRIRAGEALYIPTGWWHYVQQAKETTIAVNWWYDMEMRGMQWVLLNFLRNEEALHVET